MKKLLFSTCLTLLFSFSSVAQKVTLNDLIALCSKKKWEEVNLYLLNKGWSYFESAKGDTYKYNTITWSFNKDYYSDKAQAWFYLYTYDDLPNKVSYTVFNKDSYTLINNTIPAKGFKLINSEIEDDEVISTYSTSSWILKVHIFKSQSDDEYYDRSITSYKFFLIKKESVYDPDNGKKHTYYDNGNVKIEYILKNGVGHGPVKNFYENGQLSLEGAYLNGKKHGKFVEYSDSGKINAQYSLENGLLQGKVYLYYDGRLQEVKEYKNDTLNGAYSAFVYDDSGKVSVKFSGLYKNGKKDGIWNTMFVSDGEEEVYEFTTYKDDLKHGPFKEYLGSDTLEIGSHNHGLFDGAYKRQIKQSGYFDNGEEISWWEIDCEGTYKNGVKEGNWIYFSSLGNKSKEGSYNNGDKSGKWLSYITYGTNLGKIWGEDYYEHGKLHGKSLKYYDSREEYDSSNSSVTIINYPIYESVEYVDGKLHGEYVLKDSTGITLFKGAFLYGQKDGHWIESYTVDLDEEDIRVFREGDYEDDLKGGTWKEYLYKDSPFFICNFYRGELHGEYFSYDQFQLLTEKKKFYFGDLKELEAYFPDGSVAFKYEVIEYKSNGYICKKWDYYSDHTAIQVFFVGIPKNDFSHNNFQADFLKAVASGTGYSSGDHKVLNAEGKPMVVGKYEKNKKEGQWEYFYYDEGVKVRCNFNQDIKLSEHYLTLSEEPFSGEFKYVDEKENVKELIKVKKGLRQGKTLFIDLNTNEVIKKVSYKEGLIK